MSFADESKIKKMLSGIRDATPISDRHARQALWDRCWSRNNWGSYFSGYEEWNNFTQLRAELFAKYLRAVDEVSEFGCGAGHNLAAILDTARKLRGFDWSAQAVEQCRRRGIEAQVFDMFAPDPNVTLHGAVFTVHALEQLGRDFRPFLEFLLVRKPQIIFHIEPVEELYDEMDLQDFLSLSYHRKRGYLSGFLPHLQDLEKQGEIKIIEVRKSEIHGQFHDAYSVIAWRPK
jgi:SAM-dependent methyltransferase